MQVVLKEAVHGGALGLLGPGTVDVPDSLAYELVATKRATWPGSRPNAWPDPSGASLVSGAWDSFSRRVLVFGDSLAANYNTGYQIKPIGPIAYANAELGGAIDMAYFVQSGVGGNGYTHMLARIDAALAPYAANYFTDAILHGLTNDINYFGLGTAGYESVAVIIAGYQQVIDRLLAKAQTVSWPEVHPNAQGLSWNTSAGNRAAWRQCLAAQQAVAAANPGRIKIIPFAAAMTIADLSSGNPLFPTPLANTLDAGGVHPNNLGSAILGKLIAQAWAPRSKPMRLVVSPAETWQADNTSKIITYRPRVAGPGSAASGSFAGVQSASFIPNASGTGTGVVALVPRKALSATAWATATAFTVGTVRRPTPAVKTQANSEYVYVATAIAGTGTSGASEPAWPVTPGATVIDNAGANQITWMAVRVGNSDPKPGFWACLIAFTNSGTPAATSLFFRTFIGNASGVVGNGFVVGSVIRAACEFKLQAPTLMGGAGPYLQIQKTGGTVPHDVHYDVATTDTNTLSQDEREGVLATMWAPVEAGVTAIPGVDIGVRLSANAGSMAILLVDSMHVEVQ